MENQSTTGRKRRTIRDLVADNPDLIEAYREKRVTAHELAEKWGVPYSSLQAQFSRMGITKPIDPNSTYQQARQKTKLAAVRREYREFLASKVLAGTYTVAQAAELANCHERTIRRFMDFLSGK